MEPKVLLDEEKQYAVKIMQTGFAEGHTELATTIADLLASIGSLQDELEDERLRSDVSDENYRQVLAKSRERKEALIECIGPFVHDPHPPKECEWCEFLTLIRKALSDEPSPCEHEWAVFVKYHEIDVPGYASYWASEEGEIVDSNEVICRRCEMTADKVGVSGG